jgi:TonB-linked SusC/RagA family outer membrane protein
MKKLLMLLFGCVWLVAATAQTATVKARLVDDKTNEAIAGATVKEVKGKKFAITGTDGSFTIALTPGTTQLLVTGVGYAPKTISIADIANGEIQMTQSVQQLDAVVVTALGIKREKKALGYAVQDIKSEDLVKGRQQNLVSAMQGKIAGVNITQGSNGPGSSSQIIIRGSKFLSGTASGAGVLYVIDGVPMDNSIRGSVGEFNGADGGDGIQNISPDDIENISVLKGPNAAALYGSRAINGVIMVTTKKGSSRKGLGVSYSFDYSGENALLLPELQTSYGQGAAGVYTATSDQSWGPKVTGQALTANGWVNNAFNMEGRNVAEEMLQTGSNANHALAVTSGTEKSSVYFSLNYNKQKGIIPGNELTRYIANIRLNTKLSEKLSLESRFTYNNQKVDNRPSGGEEAANPYSSALRMPIGVPYSQLAAYEKTVLGKSTVNFFSPNSVILNNPYWFINKFKKQEIRNRLIGLLGATYAFTPDLSLTVRSGFDYYADLVDNKVASGSPTPYTNNLAGGNYNTFNRNFFTINTDFLLSYKKKFGNVGLEATAGANNRFDRVDETATNAGGINLPDVFSFGNAGAVSASNAFSRKQVNSVYGLLQGSFNEWLFADFTLRNDWYSSLKPGSNSLLYPSANLSAVISDVWKNKPSFLSFAKVRASYGVAGRDADAFAVNYYLNNAQGAIGTILSNPSVKISDVIVPEESRSLEFGTDLRFLNNRINFDFTWYKGNTINQIVGVPLEPSSGFNQLLVNAGDIENKGVEITLNVVPVKTKKFTYSSTFNFARNRSRVVKVTDGITNFGFAATRVATAAAKTGDRLGNLNVVGFRRDANGQVIVGSTGASAGLPLLTNGRTVVAGNIFPDWTGGWNNEFSYGNLSLNLLFDIRQGGVIVSHTEGYLSGLGLAKRTEANRETSFVVDGVREDGTKNTTLVTPQQYYSLIGARGGVVGEAFTYDASNMRLRQAALTYNIPATIIGKTPFRSASVSVYGRNLFFVYKNSPMDPDVTLNGGVTGYGVDFYSLPTTRSFGVNLKVGF